MITTDNAVECIEKLNAPHWRLFDYSGNMLYIYEDETDAAKSAEHLREMLKIYSGYNKVKVQAANAAQFRGNYKGAAKWDVKVGESTAPAAVASAPAAQNQFSQMMQMMQMMQVMQGMVQPNFEAKIDFLRKEMEFQNKMNEMMRNNEDPMTKYAGLMPFVGRAMGWKTDEMKEMFTMSAMAKGWSQPGTPNLQPSQPNANWQPQSQTIPNRTAGAPAEETKSKLVSDSLPIPTVEQLMPLSQDQKLAEINVMLDKIAERGQVSSEQFILLLYLIYNKPELVGKAVALYNSGMI